MKTKLGKPNQDPLIQSRENRVFLLQTCYIPEMKVEIILNSNS